MKISKKQISEIRFLHQKKFRDEHGLFLVEGTKSVLELLESEWQVKELYATPLWLGEYRGKIASPLLTIETGEKEMERISTLKTPQEVLAIVRKPLHKLQNIDTGKTILVLDGIRDPGNLGTIIRTADWFGIDQIICSEDTVEYTNPKTIQASMGSFIRTQLVYTSLEHFFSDLQEPFPVYGTFMEGIPVCDIKFGEGCRIIIGNESRGISSGLLPFITEKITIPSPKESRTESLNASVASAIVLYQYSIGKSSSSAM